MLDILFLLIVFALFLASLGIIILTDRLMEK
jgi:hypothetical protein